MSINDDQISLHIFTAIERPRSGRGCVACSAPESKHVAERVLASYAAERAGTERVGLHLSCGHRNVVHPASSVWDYPGDGSWCAQCGAVRAIAARE